MALLDVQRLHVRYAGDDGPVTAVRDVSFTLQPGEALGIVGESGSGKSSIAGAVLGLLGQGAAVAGRIVFDGDDLVPMTPVQRRGVLGRCIGSVFQDPFTALNPSLRIGRHVAEPLVQHKGMRPAEAARRAIELLADMGIPRPAEAARAFPHQLSGGMRQRALIAAALACEPPLLILDEPTTALDVTVEAQILEGLTSLRRRLSVGILFISHNLGVVRRVCDQVSVMYAGQMVELGRTAQVLARPAHPYAKGLLASVPPLRAGSRQTRLPSIGGHMAAAPPPEVACCFAPRCPFSEAACATPQAMQHSQAGHQVRCWKWDGLPDWPVTAAVDAPPPSFRAGDALVNLTGLQKTYHARGVLGAWRLARSDAQSGGRLRLQRNNGGVAAVDGVSLSISPSEVLGLVGESGCGKSSLGRLALRLARPSAGTVEFDGRDVTSEPEQALRPFRRRAQIVFQNVGSSLNPRLTIGEALERPLALFDLVPRAGRADRVTALLDMVRLPAAYRARFPHQLSGGERQRVAIARALATEPSFIVCDEPVSALDVSVQAAVVNLLADLRNRLGLAYLFVSHDLAVVAQLSDRIAVMYRGTIVETGGAGEVLAPPYHPYTAALLSSAAHAGPLADGLDVAAPPAPGGCPFTTRCAHRMPVCDESRPPLRRRDGTHDVACHLSLLPGAATVPMPEHPF